MQDALLSIIEKTALNNAEKLRQAASIIKQINSKQDYNYLECFSTDNIEVLFDYYVDALYIKIFLKAVNVEVIYELEVKYQQDIIIDILLAVQNKNISINIIA